MSRTARRTPTLLSPERFVAAGEGGVSARFGGVGAWHARSNSAVFHAAEIAAEGMLLFFRKSATMDILNIRGQNDRHQDCEHCKMCFKFPILRRFINGEKTSGLLQQ